MLKTLMVKSTLVAFVCCVSFTAHARADSPRPINVPAGELVTALETLSKQAAVELVYQPAQLKSFQTSGVKGTYTPEAAIRILLKGTPLELRTDPSGAMLIAPPHTNTTSDNSSTSGSDEAKEGKKSSSEQFQLAHADQGQTSGPSTVEKQDEQAAKRKIVQLEEVVVTGTRIPLTAGQQQVEPVRSYTREDIENSGQTTVADFLNNLPDVSSRSDEGLGTHGFPGKTTVQLHGLPVGTTLTLLNGQRVETSYYGFFDLSSIPSAAIDRVDVLPVGASAIYGADALAGAVNIILRKNFNGFSADAKLAHVQGANDTIADVAWGESWERGSVSFLGTFQRRDQLVGSQRELLTTTNFPASAPTFAYIQDACSPGNVYSLNGQNLPGLSSPQAGIPAGITGRPTIGQFAATVGTLNQCNVYQNTAITPYFDREGALLSAHHEVTESADLFTDIMFSRDDMKAFSGYFINASFPISATTLSANNPYNPFGEDVGISFANAAIPLSSDSSSDFIRPLIGLRGSVFSDWHYEVSAYISHDHFDYGSALLSSQALQDALNSSNLATALNPFTMAAPGSAQLLQTLSSSAMSSHYLLSGQLIDGQAIVRGPLFSLPAGPLEAVVGSEYTREKQFHDFAGFDVLEVQRRSYAIFTEERLPLLAASDRSQKGERLALTVAGRYDHTNDFGGKATWQSGLLWRPSETLSVSASYGLSYRAPQLQEIGGTPRIFSNVNFGLIDPFRGNQPVVSDFISGANPNLKPETGNSRTLGIVYNSQALRGFSGSLTWYALTISNYIAVPSAQLAIDNPSIYPGSVVRDALTPADQQLGYTAGKIAAVKDLYFNFGDLRVAGFDADASYGIDTSFGQFKPSIALSNIYRWQSALTPNTPSVEYVSQESINAVGFAPRWKGTAALAWQGGPVAVNLAGRYIGRYKDFQEAVPNNNELGNSWIFDLNVRYDAGRALGNLKRGLAGSYISLGAVNLFDKAPPFSYGFYPYDFNETDIRGRMVYVQAGVGWR